MENKNQKSKTEAQIRQGAVAKREMQNEQKYDEMESIGRA
jgi:hypothetical protein